MPEVSIIMPASNAEALIGQSIESVLDGTFQDWELLVVDDGSTDETAAVVKRYNAADRRVQYLRIERGGSAKALNAALARIPLERPYLAFIESGHLWNPEKLDTQLGQLHESGAEAVLCAIEGGHVTGGHRFDGEPGVAAALELKAMSISSWLCRRMAVETLGNFTETGVSQGFEAFSMMLKLLRHGFSAATFPEAMVRPAASMTKPEAEPLTDIRSELAVLRAFRFSHEAAESATRHRILDLYRAQFDLLAAARDKSGIRSQIPALNAFLGNPRIGSALANMLFLPAGLYRKFAHWLLSSLMK